MSALHVETRAIWLRLLNEGGSWIAPEVADLCGNDVGAASRRLRVLAQLQYVQRRGPAGAGGRIEFGVTGTCKVPPGISVAEAQA